MSGSRAELLSPTIQVIVGAVMIVVGGAILRWRGRIIDIERGVAGSRGRPTYWTWRARFVVAAGLLTIAVGAIALVTGVVRT